MSEFDGSREAVVIGTGVFAARFPDTNSWVARAPADAPREPSGELIEKRSRRRVSELTKALADAYAEALTQSGADGRTIPTVFGSALGEASTMIGLLDQMWRDHEAPSPMRFALSVHNAASGSVSISLENRAFTTSLGADFDTPAMAIAEAMGVLATCGAPVAVVCGDDAVPLDIVPRDEAWALVATALVLAPAGGAWSGPTIRGPVMASRWDEPSAIPGELARNPTAGMLDLIDAIRSGRPTVVRADRGSGVGWCLDVKP